MTETARQVRANRLTPLRFVVMFGLVSALSDVVYEGARSIIGPFLGQLGASAALVGLITGVGEAVALVLRLFTGRLSDRTGRPWIDTGVAASDFASLPSRPAEGQARGSGGNLE